MLVTGYAYTISRLGSLIDPATLSSTLHVFGAAIENTDAAGRFLRLWS